MIAVQSYRSRKQQQKQAGALKDNPFALDSRKPPPRSRVQPSDKKTASKNPLPTGKDDVIDTHYDVICIGSGLGSMTTAATLSKAGQPHIWTFD